jgi:hypothetical protein
MGFACFAGRIQLLDDQQFGPCYAPVMDDQRDTDLSERHLLSLMLEPGSGGKNLII